MHNVGFGPHVLIPFFVPSLAHSPCPHGVQQRQRARALLQLHDEEDDDAVPNACPTRGLQQQQQHHCVRSQSKIIWQKLHFEPELHRGCDQPDKCYASKYASFSKKPSLSSRDLTILRSDTNMHKWEGKIGRSKS